MYMCVCISMYVYINIYYFLMHCATYYILYQYVLLAKVEINKILKKIVEPAVANNYMTRVVNKDSPTP